jgi:hypothetical protein
MACRAVLEKIVAWEPDLIASHEARFSAPVYPGETLDIVLWRDNSNVFFEAGVLERDTKVLTGGKTLLRLQPRNSPAIRRDEKCWDDALRPRRRSRSCKNANRTR